MTDRFHRFPDLAPELRVKIWKFYLHVPRRIKLIERSFSCCEFCNNCNYYKYVETEGLPALLSVNQESRHESLKCYQRLQRAGVCEYHDDFYCDQHQEPQDTGDLHESHDLRRSDGIYINLCIDVIHFSYDDKSFNFLSGCLLSDRIEHVVITAYSVVFINMSSTEQFVRDLREWDYLKSFKLLINFTEPDPLKALSDMIKFKDFFEMSIDDWGAWRFPQLTVVGMRTGTVLAERQRCLRNEAQESYHWKIMGVDMIHTPLTL